MSRTRMTTLVFLLLELFHFVLFEIDFDVRSITLILFGIFYDIW